MKRKRQVVVAALFGVYIVSYIPARFAFYRGTVFPVDLPSVDHTTTDFWIPRGGASRYFRYSIWWLYRPLSYVDQTLTRRPYEVIDEQYVRY
jgi:hypothetical protein